MAIKQWQGSARNLCRLRKKRRVKCIFHCMNYYIKKINTWPKSVIERVYANDREKSVCVCVFFSFRVALIQPHEYYLILCAEDIETYYEINKLECQIEVKRVRKWSNERTNERVSQQAANKSNTYAHIKKNNIDMIKWDCSCCANWMTPWLALARNALCKFYLYSISEIKVSNWR